MVIGANMTYDERFFASRGLEGADGRPLHGWRVSDVEKAELRRNLFVRVSSGQVLESTAKWFVLWAAEHINRTYARGVLSWELVFGGLGVSVDIKLAHALTGLGLKAWGRPLRRRASDNAALYLQSLLAEGGLPDALLSRESGYQKAVLAAVEELERHGNADPETARLIADRTLNRLPEVFGHADSSLLLAELALAIVELRRALPPEIDEAAIETWLDRAVPGWADRFPIRLSEAARAAILRPALRRESTRSESNGPPLLRALRPRADGAGWLGIIKATGGVLPDALIPAAARGQILRLTSEQGLILRAHPEAGGWRLDPVGRNFTVMPLVEPAIFTANLDGRALCDVVLEAGLPEPEEILSFWVSGEEGGLKPAAQPRTRSDRIWVLAPEGVTGEPDAGVTILGAASAPGGRLWELSGVGEIRFGPHRTSIATGAETDAQSLQILPFGEIFRGWRALGRLPVYQGRMRYLGADLGLPLRDLQGQIRETPMRRVLGGRIVQWHLGGDLCAALRCVVLPADLQIDAGEIAPGVVEARAKGLPVGWRMSLAAAGVQTPFGTEARLDVGARDPGDIVLTLHDTASGLSLDLVRAWPARAPLLISPEGERLRSNRVLALRSIHGWRGVLPEQGAAVQLRIAKAAHAIGFAEAGQIRLASYGALLGQALAMTGADGKVNLRLVAGVETNRLEIGRYDWELPRGDAPDLGAEPCRLTALTVAPPHELRVKEVEGPLDLSGWLSDVSGIWFVQGQSARGVMRPFPWSSDPLPRSTREARIETYLAQIQGLMRRPTDPGWGEIEALIRLGRAGGDCGALDQVQALGAVPECAVALLLRTNTPAEILDLETEAPLWWPLTPVSAWRSAVLHLRDLLMPKLEAAGFSAAEAKEMFLTRLRQQLGHVVSLRRELSGHVAQALGGLGLAHEVIGPDGKVISLRVMNAPALLTVSAAGLVARSPVMPQGSGGLHPKQLVAPKGFSRKVLPALEAPLIVAEVAAGLAKHPVPADILELLALRLVDPDWFDTALPLAIQIALSNPGQRK
ncbi:hypothetical protein AP071_15830 [Rhodobacter capsulatus]|nr:hypothetical protein AP073_15725 [Rhodobacter capsulatus]KQB14223.1 hypothetical protein AP071_15830 [Rhodobacter capsulatus]